MKVVFYLNVVSPHQLPLANEVVKRIGESEFRYVYQMRSIDERAKMGWGQDGLQCWCVPFKGNENLVEEAELLYSGVRDIDLFERRARAGKKTLYYSERWFKPKHGLPGLIRMFVPSYRKMARRFVAWLNSDPNARYLAVGPWAAKDLRWLGMNVEKIVPWGYFVAPSTHSNIRTFEHSDIRLLWVGRLLGWKRVSDIVRAIYVHDRQKRMDELLPRVVLDIYGSGVEERRLRRLVDRLGLNDHVKFHSQVPIAEVRNLMREHDVYVLSSDANEGWGAVVCEALEEGMKVIGTYEAGSSAAILPESNLYHAGDWRRLAELISSDVRFVDIGEWTAKRAAERLLNAFQGGEL